MLYRECPKCGSEMRFEECLNEELEIGGFGKGWLIREEVWECKDYFNCGYWESVEFHYNVILHHEDVTDTSENGCCN